MKACSFWQTETTFCRELGDKRRRTLRSRDLRNSTFDHGKGRRTSTCDRGVNWQQEDERKGLLSAHRRHPNMQAVTKTDKTHNFLNMIAKKQSIEIWTFGNNCITGGFKCESFLALESRTQGCEVLSLEKVADLNAIQNGSAVWSGQRVVKKQAALTPDRSRPCTSLSAPLRCSSAL